MMIAYKKGPGIYADKVGMGGRLNAYIADTGGRGVHTCPNTTDLRDLSNVNAHLIGPGGAGFHEASTTIKAFVFLCGSNAS